MEGERERVSEKGRRTGKKHRMETKKSVMGELGQRDSELCVGSKSDSLLIQVLVGKSHKTVTIVSLRQLFVEEYKRNQRIRGEGNWRYLVFISFPMGIRGGSGIIRGHVDIEGGGK